MRRHRTKSTLSQPQTPLCFLVQHSRSAPMAALMLRPIAETEVGRVRCQQHSDLRALEASSGWRYAWAARDRGARYNCSRCPAAATSVQAEPDSARPLAPAVEVARSSCSCHTPTGRGVTTQHRLPIVLRRVAACCGVKAHGCSECREIWCRAHTCHDVERWRLPVRSSSARQ